MTGTKVKFFDGRAFNDQLSTEVNKFLEGVEYVAHTHEQHGVNTRIVLVYKEGTKAAKVVGGTKSKSK